MNETIRRHRGINSPTFSGLSVIAPACLLASTFTQAGDADQYWSKIPAHGYTFNRAQPTYGTSQHNFRLVYVEPKANFEAELSSIYKLLQSKQEPLGAEFEAIWDANVDQLYES